MSYRPDRDFPNDTCPAGSDCSLHCRNSHVLALSAVNFSFPWCESILGNHKHHGIFFRLYKAYVGEVTGF